MVFRRELLKREASGEPIRVGVVGAGRMGTGVINQICTMRGIKVVAVADLVEDRAFHAFKENGMEGQIVAASQEGPAQDALRRGKVVVTQDARLLPRLDLDAIVEATGIPEIGAMVAYASILGKKHVVMLNVEADVVVGPILSRLARAAGVVYTLAAGDQPGAICEMAEWATGLGLKIVAAGRGTLRGPGDREATPEDSKEKAEQLGLNPKMYNSFRDGTKAQTEMTAVANALGLPPEVRGMHEPFASVDDLPRLFCLKEEGGLLSQEGVVELANGITPEGKLIREGKVFPGVFLVVTSDHPGVRQDLAYVMDPTLIEPSRKGKTFVLFRPYHLCSIETPNSVAQAVLLGQPTGAPGEKPVAELITIAKRDLKAGEILDGGGGFTVYGLIERAEVAKVQNLLPFGFAYEARLKADVKKGEAIRWDQVQVNEDSFLLKLRRLQEAEVG